MISLTKEQQQLKPRSLADIRLTADQTTRKNQFYKEVLKTGAVTPSQAYLLADMLLQDELLGLQARTPAQLQLAKEYAIALAGVRQ